MRKIIEFIDNDGYGKFNHNDAIEILERYFFKIMNNTDKKYLITIEEVENLTNTINDYR